MSASHGFFFTFGCMSAVGTGPHSGLWCFASVYLSTRVRYLCIRTQSL